MSGADFPESVKRALRPGRAAKLNRFATIVDHVRSTKGVRVGGPPGTPPRKNLRFK